MGGGDEGRIGLEGVEVEGVEVHALELALGAVNYAKQDRGGRRDPLRARDPYRGDHLRFKV